MDLVSILFVIPINSTCRWVFKHTHIYKHTHISSSLLIISILTLMNLLPISLPLIIWHSSVDFIFYPMENIYSHSHTFDIIATPPLSQFQKFYSLTIFSFQLIPSSTLTPKVCVPIGPTNNWSYHIFTVFNLLICSFLSLLTLNLISSL